MPTLRSGAVILGAYATKIRKALFAQLKDKVKAGEISSQEVARASGELNKVLYTLFVEKLKLEKGDVVRVEIDYEILNSKIIWKWSDIKISCYRKVSDEEIGKNLKEVLASSKPKEFFVKKVRETSIGDVIFEVFRNEEKVGLLVVTPLEEEVIVRGAIKPSTIIPKTRIRAEGSVEEYLNEAIDDLLRIGKQVEIEEVEKMMREISPL